MIVNPIQRRPTRKIRVGSVYVGGDAPISIQSMTNTETCDVDATVAQIQRCADVGADIMRVSVPSMEAAEAFGEIRKRDIPANWDTAINSRYIREAAVAAQ